MSEIADPAPGSPDAVPSADGVPPADAVADAPPPEPEPSRPRGPHRGLRMAATTTAVVVLAIAMAGFGLVTRYTAAVERTDVFGSIEPLTRPAAGTGTTLLLVGMDSREGLSTGDRRALHVGTGDYGRPQADLIMLVHVSPSQGRITAVSLPPDSYVDVPAYTTVKGTVQQQRKNRLSAAYEAGGAPLLVRTVEAATGIRLDHYIEVDFPGFLEMVDAIGGVPVCTTKKLVDQRAGLLLPAGTTEVSGLQALAFVRAKSVDSEYGRMARHQRFLSAAVQKATSAGTLLNPLAINALLHSASTSIRTDSSLDRDGLLALGDRLRSVSPGDILLFTVPLEKTGYRVDIGRLKNQPTSLWSDEAKDLFVRLQQDKPLTAQESDVDPEAVIAVRVAPSKVRVQVYNAAGTTGLGRRVADDLTAAGYQVIGKPQNAKTTGATTTTIEYDPEFDESLKTLRAAFPSASVKPAKGIGNAFRLYVGADYAGVRPVTVSATAIGPIATINSPTKPRTAADSTCA